MRAQKTVLTLAFCLAAAVSFAASDAFMGTWKLNEAKSKIGAGAPKINTVVYEAAGDSIKVTVDITTPDGSTIHSDWTGKFDGKDYPSTGNPGEGSRSYTQVNDRTLHFVSKQAGKIVLSGRVVVSADGKSRTVTSSGTGPQGTTFKSTEVYDKQ